MSSRKTIPESHKVILESAIFAFVSTVRAKDQFISTNPVSFDWDGDKLRFSTLKSRVKYKNLQADSRITICVLDPVNPTRYVEIRGYASLADDPDGSLNQKIYRKNMGRDFDMDEPGAERVIVTVDPEQVSAPLLYGGRLDHIGSE